VQLGCTVKSHPTAVTIPHVQCSSVVQQSLIQQQSLYRKFSAVRLYSQVSSHSSKYTASSVQLDCTAISHPTAVTIPQVQCSSVVQPSLIPQQSLNRKFSAALLYSQDSSQSIHYTVSSVQLCSTAKSHPTTVTILPVQCSSVVQPSLIPQQSLYRKLCAALLYSQDSSQSIHYKESSVQLCCTDKSHPTAFAILQVQFSSVVQPRLIPKQSL